MARRGRTEIREEQREILKSFFREGMTRVGSPIIPKAASATGLEPCVIENWIGNYRRCFKTSSEPRRTKLKLHTRELSPYNLFCRDLLRNKGTMNDIKGRWATLGDDEKQKYFKEAAALRLQGQAEDLSPEMRELKIKKHLKQLKIEVSKLEALGVESSILLFDPQNSSLEVYELRSKGATDLFDAMDGVNDFGLHYKACASAASPSTKDHVDVLIKKVQELFNQKYKEAGGTGRLPYQSLMNQSVTVTAAGLPNGLTLRKPSFYGRNQLETILKHANQISFQINAAQCSTAQELSEDMDAEDERVHTNSP
ncbi:general transcription factor II-I repeat domain-containing protein 1 isoform X2 [Parambassis ranga]|uniref:General transcription factor II-I repeat domain-containing protein 1 isoform X2 n=1 Tax=Parambassis ranga TaxID=210632 RepID=A0A6P7IW19_9TELE|nr:general transcription factor II-I repeat domain-containing protein 1-like isoform X2 [Parambassis ranga]